MKLLFIEQLLYVRLCTGHNKEISQSATVPALKGTGVF